MESLALTPLCSVFLVPSLEMTCLVAPSFRFPSLWKNLSMMSLNFSMRMVRASDMWTFRSSLSLELVSWVVVILLYLHCTVSNRIANKQLICGILRSLVCMTRTPISFTSRYYQWGCSKGSRYRYTSCRTGVSSKAAVFLGWYKFSTLCYHIWFCKGLAFPILIVLRKGASDEIECWIGHESNNGDAC